MFCVVCGDWCSRGGGLCTIGRCGSGLVRDIGTVVMATVFNLKEMVLFRGEQVLGRVITHDPRRELIMVSFSAGLQ